MTPVRCPDANALSRFAEGRLQPDKRAAIEAHIDQCAECFELVAELAAERAEDARTDPAHRGADTAPSPRDEFATVAEPEAAASASTRAEIHEGTFGRYLVVELLGAGGMGQVYVAHDPELDRQVALKVVRPDRRPPADASPGAGSSSSGGARLLREAQATASLSHPNVVTIYDVGTVDGQVFIAMELIDGEPLGKWQARPDRSWREILAMYVQAGEGLAAAHAAKLLHRDFKPDNVLVGRDGVARVLDFGLAKPTESSEPHADFRIERARLIVPDDLTLAGSIVGTPAYMAPEQLRGEAVDARADQFSFCVALWQALYGRRPFAGETLAELVKAILAGRIEDPDPADARARRRVPRWLERALRRGLAARPEDRHPSMRALLDDLARHQRDRRRLGLVGLGVAGSLAIASVGYVQGRSHDGEGAKPCAGVDARVDEVWSAPRRATIAEAFTASQLGFAPSSWTSAADSIDAYVDRLRASYVSTCEATHVQQTQSTAILDLRTRCLDRRLGELDALLELLESPDAALIERAPRAVAALPAIAGCDDVDQLERVDPLPEDPSLRADIDAAYAALDRLHARSAAGRYEEAAELAAELVSTADALDYGPLRAAAHYREGDLRDRLGDPQAGEASMRRALILAEASGDEVVAVESWTALIYIVGLELARADEARFIADYAAAKLARLDAAPGLERQLLANRGMLEYSTGDFEAATATIEAAIELVEAQGELDAIALAQLLDVLGSLQRQRGQAEAAEATFERDLELLKAELGPDHPMLASAHGNLSAALYAEARYDEAQHHAERALALSRAASGRSIFVAAALNNLANIHASKGDYARALELNTEALELRESIYGREHPDVAQSLDNLGGALLHLGRAQEALARHEEALAIRVAIHGAEHPWTSHSHAGIGDAAYELGDHERAVTELELALARLDQPEGVDELERGAVELSLARALDARDGELSKARIDALLASAREHLSADPELLAEVEAWQAER